LGPAGALYQGGDQGRCDAPPIQCAPACTVGLAGAGAEAGRVRLNSIAGWAEGYYLSELRRAGQAFELRLALDQIFADEPQALVSIAGDFNAEEHHTPLDIIRGEVDNTGNGALVGSEMIPLEHAVDESRRFTVIHQGRRQMLDHVLVSRPLMGRFKASEIHNEALADEFTGYASVEASPASYHAPVLAVFDLPLD
jgi:endonuclease/exonuclease/phosphatase family metal-dependent hydrolase